MGCNCKKNLKNIEKYSDNYNPTNTISGGLTLLEKLINYLLRIVLVIFAIGVFMIISPLLLMYVLVCVILGKTPKLTIKSFKKKKH